VDAFGACLSRSDFERLFAIRLHRVDVFLDSFWHSRFSNTQTGARRRNDCHDADVGAYFFGRAFGRRKLAPSISPGKSWEGAIGGAFLVVILSLFTAASPDLAQTLPALLVGKWSGIVATVFLLALVALSVMGDLHESLLKRLAGVKDSGNSLPGHGGFFDRTDALIPTMPAAYLLWSISM
jgi:phosphatidate cytidylyltransferase